jgi:outer membrane lipoprotein SlyB
MGVFINYGLASHVPTSGRRKKAQRWVRTRAGLCGLRFAGNIETASKSKDVTIRTAGGAILGAIIGGIAKGGKGAAIGAIIGAGVGAGSVYVQGNKDLVLERGTEMSVRTSASLRERAAM